MTVRAPSPRGDTAVRWALVTGASSGIGRAFAERLARDGHGLVLVARRGEVLDELGGRLRAEHGVPTETLVADLSIEDDMRRVGRRLTAEPFVDLLVNNAGSGTYGALSDLDPEGEADEVRLLVLATVRLSQAALPGMLARQRGAIVNVASTAAFRPGPFHATYCAAKAFVASFTEALYEEVRGTEVAVLLVCPGATRTEFFERAGVDTSRLPTVAWSTPEQVVDGALRALQRRRAVCIPSLGNRADLWVRRWLPRALVRRLAGIVGRRSFR